MILYLKFTKPRRLTQIEKLIFNARIWKMSYKTISRQVIEFLTFASHSDLSLTPWIEKIDQQTITVSKSAAQCTTRLFCCSSMTSQVCDLKNYGHLIKEMNKK